MAGCWGGLSGDQAVHDRKAGRVVSSTWLTWRRVYHGDWRGGLDRGYSYSYQCFLSLTAPPTNTACHRAPVRVH